MNHRGIAGSIIALSLAALSSPSRAWGPVGHRAVASIAQGRLSAGTLQAVQEILGPGVTLEQVANCADAFAYGGQRVCAGSFAVLGEPAESKPWHFIDIPVSEQADESSLTKHCPNGTDCVVAQIRKDMRILSDGRASRQERQTALMFLVHFVGDAHQPLHCADDGDAGGNGKPVDMEYRGKTMNLHQLWDAAMEDPGDVDYREPPETLAANSQRLTALLRRDLGSLDAAPMVAGDLPARMALESARIAREVIYPEYALDHGDVAGGTPGASYRDKMRPIAYQRIELAGVRLAAMLEQALGAAGAAPAVSYGDAGKVNLARARARLRPLLESAPLAFDGGR